MDTDRMKKLQALANLAREHHLTLQVGTNSGTQYLLEPLSGMRWAITRKPTNGAITTEIGGVWWRGQDLYIGSWTTTGLATLGVLV